METDGSSNAGIGSGATPSGGQTQSGTAGNLHRSRQVAAGAETAQDDVLVSGSDIYDPLLKKGAIGSNGQFVWDEGQMDTDDSAESEAARFWHEEEMAFVARRQQVDADREARESVEHSLPEDIMPSFDQMRMNKEPVVEGPAQGVWKKQKTFGPVQPVRQSSRFDRSKNMMDKAMELKEKKNMMGPAKEDVRFGSWLSPISKSGKCPSKVRIGLWWTSSWR